MSSVRPKSGSKRKTDFSGAKNGPIMPGGQAALKKVAAEGILQGQSRIDLPLFAGEDGDVGVGP